MKVYKDPTTGEFVPAPAGTAFPGLSGQVAGRMDSTGWGLVEVASPVPGGGVMVDLQGTFQQAMTATIDEHGGLSVGCRSLEADTHTHERKEGP
jgi:hypothetical protein